MTTQVIRYVNDMDRDEVLREIQVLNDFHEDDEVFTHFNLTRLRKELIEFRKQYKWRCTPRDN